MWLTLYVKSSCKKIKSFQSQDYTKDKLGLQCHTQIGLGLGIGVGVWVGFGLGLRWGWVGDGLGLGLGFGWVGV